MRKLSVIITAGGSSIRYGNKNKLLEKINNKEVIIHSIEAFFPLNPSEIIVSASESLIPVLKTLFFKYALNNISIVKIVKGGNTRQASIYNALKSCKNKDIVAIHDAARPLIKTCDIEKCLQKAVNSDAAIVAVKAVDTIKVVKETGEIDYTPERSTLWAVQTPQIFDYKLIFDAHKKLEGQNFSDDSGMLEYLGHKVYISEGSVSNIKITSPKDLYLAQILYESEV